MQPKFLIIVLSLILFFSVVISASFGALFISPMQIFSIVLDTDWHTFEPFQANVFWQIRLPRVFLAVLVGAALSASGAAMQGIFRNPLADPGLIGISSGAALFAVLSIVGVAWYLPQFKSFSILGYYSTHFITFFGALCTALVVFLFSRTGGKTGISLMLLIGVAINALCGSLVGLLTYTATDLQLRSITFWMMGSLAGANWLIIQSILPFTLIPIFILPFVAKGLDVLALGEDEAFALGVNVQRLKIIVIICTTLAVGASVASCGMIGFLGLIVPHFVRLMAGSSHRFLLIGSAISGGILLSISDLVCRTIFAPAELPINILTAIIGTPVFISIILKEKSKNSFI